MHSPRRINRERQPRQTAGLRATARSLVIAYVLENSHYHQHRQTNEPRA
jgi:hypothetical protein